MSGECHPCFTIVLYKHINLTVYLYLQAQSLSRLGDLSGAERILNQVLDHHSHHLEALHQLANIMGLQQRHLEAVQVLQKTIKLASSDKMLLPTLYFEIANHYKDLTNMQQAFHVSTLQKSSMSS